MKTTYLVQQPFHDKLSGLRMHPGQRVVHSDTANVVEFLSDDGQPLTNELHGHPETDPPFFKAYFAEQVADGNLAVDAPKASPKADAGKVDPPKQDPPKTDPPVDSKGDASKKTGK